MTRYKTFLTQKELQVKMGLELVHEVSAGTIEMLSDEKNQPLFKGTELENYLGIRNIVENFKDFPSPCTSPNSEIEAGGLTGHLGRAKNPHDIFINLEVL